jgi:hypothetical protein
VADDQAYLDTLLAKRAATVGIKGTSFQDQRTDFDIDGLNREIARVERAMAGGSRTRYAVVNRGLDSLSDE